MDEVRLIILDPAHFHAALVQKEMYSGVSSEVAVYAPLGFELTEHLVRITRFNLRPETPTAWKLDIHTGPDFLERMIKERPGNVAVLSGRNSAKIDRIQRCIESGLHVLADKPWILHSRNLPKIREALELAEKKDLVAYDIMTERYEVTSILQRELVNTPEVFGAILAGDLENPAVFMESTHRLMKSVAGVPSLRPTWFFDIDEQGEALADVGTHLVDLAQWTVFPAQAIDYLKDIRMLDARRWPTKLSREQWRQVTGAAEFPPFLSSHIEDGKLNYYCNNFVSYALRSVHVQMNVMWDFEGPPSSDTFLARFRGSKSRVEVRQGSVENFRPEVYVVPNDGMPRNELLEALRKKIGSLRSSFEGLDVEERGDEFRLTIPERHRVGHEAHFAQVTRQFFKYLENPQVVPEWETPNMLAKYYVTTAGCGTCPGQPS
jgi:predicted dehydrogenase